MTDTAAVRALLRAWYERAHRALPWRETLDPYRIWISEIMLQQTRVAAVLPFYERFLERFPSPAALAAAPEPEVLACWSGLGYYSRARNLRRAAQAIEARGGFPRDYQSIRALPGIGDYTAAAIASIAFDLPYAVLDGNVMRVLARLTGERGDIGAAATRHRLRAAAERLLDRAQPGLFNQALMELGATVCLPRVPQCLLCPVLDHCEARQQGRERELPIKLRQARPVRIQRSLLFIEKRGRVLLWRRDRAARRMAGFWELPEPEQLPAAAVRETLGEVRHTIVNHHYRVSVVAAAIRGIPRSFRWIPRVELARLPLSTLARKALACAGVSTL